MWILDLYTEICKTLMSYLEAGTNRWKDIPCSWLGGSIMWNCSITKTNSQIQHNPYQNSNSNFFIELRKQSSNLYGNMKPFKYLKQSSVSRSKLQPSDIMTNKLCYKSLIKVLRYWHKNRRIDKWSKSLYNVRLIYIRCTRNTEHWNNNPFNTQNWENWLFTLK